MLTIPEYDLTKPSTLTVLTENDVISAGEAKWFRRQLEWIAGKTLTGQPRLQIVWGPTYIDPMSTDSSQLKYLDFSYGGEQFGERRFFLEIHRTPEFLARSGRYQIETRQDVDGAKLLKSLPSEGCYDYWLRLERANLTYLEPNQMCLNIAKALWDWEQLPQGQRDALEQADREIERRQMIAEQRREMGGGIYTGAMPPTIWTPR